MNIAGKAVLVTGGASGLGAATARMAASAGANVVIADLNAELGDALAKEIGGKYIRTDVTDAGQGQAAVAAAGQVSVLVNCAGIGSAERVLGKEGPASLERFTKVIQVNLIGTFNMIRLAAAAMNANAPDADGARGVIVNTASIAAFDGQIGQAAYSASKGGIAGMTLPIARDLARHGIRVVTIAPGLFDTPLLASLPEEARLALAANVPYPPRLGQPAEFAALVKHIIENQMLNGEVIRLDGALRMAPK